MNADAHHCRCSETPTPRRSHAVRDTVADAAAHPADSGSAGEGSTERDGESAPQPAGQEPADPDRSASESPASALSAIDVQLTLETPDVDPPFADWGPPLIERLIRLLGWSQADLSVAVVDDATMADLHVQYKNVPGTTDVLTFDLRAVDLRAVDLGETDAAALASTLGATFDEPLEAELILCIDEAARQAAARGHEVRAELLLYAVHGLLHLAGHDDHDPAAAARMHQREDQLLAMVGLPAVYSRGGRAADGDPDGDPDNDRNHQGYDAGYDPLT